jgi:hypothetical protein
MPARLDGIEWEGRHARAARRWEGAMTYDDDHRGERTRTRRSSRSALNPYVIEDVAMTAAELQRVRADVVSVGLPR